MKVSIIIVSYKTRALLLDCLASVFRSERDFELEVMVVDNASDDGTVEAVREAYPQCLVIENGLNEGFSRANNRAIRQSTGNYILLLNPDTLLSEDVLSKMADFMEMHADVGIVSCKLVTGDGSLDLACRRSFPTFWDGFCRATGLSFKFPKHRVFSGYNLTYLDEAETHEVDIVNGAFMFTRRKAIEDVGLLDEDFFLYGEDMDWCFRFKKAKWKVMYHPAATTVHLKGNSSNPRSSRTIREMFRSTALFYRKHEFENIGPVHKRLIICSLTVWKWITLSRNAFRTNKRTRP